MKKLLVIVTSLLALTASQALAKTEGSSVGLSVFKAEQTTRSSLNVTNSFKDNNIGFGLNYKYAIPVAYDFYVAPGVSYDRIGTKAHNTVTTTGSDRVDVNNRYSVRADVGYDVNDTLAVYGVIGYSALGAEVSNYRGSLTEKNNTHRNFAALYGLGAKTAISKDFDLTFELTTQRANLQTASSAEKSKTQLNTYGVGLAYNF